MPRHRSPVRAERHKKTKKEHKSHKHKSNKHSHPARHVDEKGIAQITK